MCHARPTKSTNAAHPTECSMPSTRSCQTTACIPPCGCCVDGARDVRGVGTFRRLAASRGCELSWPIAYHLSPIAHRLWTIAHCPWPMVYCPWPMACNLSTTGCMLCLRTATACSPAALRPYGMWHMACGIWHMACGMWHVAYGIWHALCIWNGL